MRFIAVKWSVQEQFTDQWLNAVAGFTSATRSEPGNLFFEWSRSVEDPNTFVLLEAFTDDETEPHVNCDHFRSAMDTLGGKLTERPKVINFQHPTDGWVQLGELRMDD